MTPEDKRQLWRDAKNMFGTEQIEMIVKIMGLMIDKKMAERKAKTDAVDAEFEQWYAEYPRKEAKKPARKAWENPENNVLPLDQMLSVLDSQKKQWKKDKTAKKHIPMPSTYLNQGRHFDTVTEITNKKQKLCIYCNTPAGSFTQGVGYYHFECQIKAERERIE